VQSLAAQNILALGVGKNVTSTYQPIITITKGIRIALFGFNDVIDPEDKPTEGESWGRAWLNESALLALQQIRKKVDILVVLVHWGKEYALEPSLSQRAWAKKLAEAGADAIIGSHPHVLQPTEILTSSQRTSFVAYSLGNFLFDQPFSAETKKSLVLRILFDKRGIALAATSPLEISEGQVRPLQFAKAQKAWKWNGQIAQTITLTNDLSLPKRSNHLAADLRGDDKPLWATLTKDGEVKVRLEDSEKAQVVWENEADDWQITRIAVGDPNDDGRSEFVFLLWKPDPNLGGQLHSHPFLMGWRGGYYRIIWGGSATTIPIQDLDTADLDGDGRQELVILEGGQKPNDPPEMLSLWHWHGWGFQREWSTSLKKQQTQLFLQDIDNDGLSEIVLEAQ